MRYIRSFGSSFGCRAVLFALVTAVLASNAAGAQTILTVQPCNSSTVCPSPFPANLTYSYTHLISPTFFGVNGQARNSTSSPWINGNSDQTDFKTALKGMHYGVLRIPGGTGSNFWNWADGTVGSSLNPGDFNGYYIPGDSTVTSPISEFNNELTTAAQSGYPATVANVEFNLVTLSSVCGIAQSGCSVPAPIIDASTDAMNVISSIDLSKQDFVSDQIAALGDIYSAGINVGYIELGNEIYSGNPCNGGKSLTTGKGTYPSRISGTVDLAGLGFANYLADTNSDVNWVARIQGAVPSGASVPKIGVPMYYFEANYDTAVPRTQNWNQEFLSALALPGVDAVVLHVYPDSNLENYSSAFPQVGDNDDTYPFGINTDTHNPYRNVAAVVLDRPFRIWNDLMKNYLVQNNASNPFGVMKSSKGFNPDVWFTEYNLKGGATAVMGTWAQGLVDATFSLKMLESSAVTMADHHDGVGGPEFADIYSTTGEFIAGTTPPPNSSVCAAPGGNGPTYPNVTAIQTGMMSNPTVATTSPNGYSAQGIAMSMLNAAMLGQTEATLLYFTGTSGVPMIKDSSTDPTESAKSTTYPQVYGWEFSGGASPLTPQLVIVNLGASNITLDLSSLSAHGGTYSQVYGFPGDYVTGTIVSGNYGAFQVGVQTSGGTPTAVADSLTSVSATIGATNKVVTHPYSITTVQLP